METVTEPATATPAPARPSKAALWIGWVLTVLPSLLLIFSAVMKFTGGEELRKGMDHLGWPIRLALVLGVVELACTIVLLIPRTTVLGAILLAGYLGGAIATHVRVGDPWIMPFLLGVVIWLGVFLREPRLRALIPLRRGA